jgi:hypothetical protein
LKPIGRNNYGALFEYMAPLPVNEEDPLCFVLPPQSPGLALFKPEARICRCCGAVYCDLLPVAPQPHPQSVSPRR